MNPYNRLQRQVLRKVRRARKKGEHRIVILIPRKLSYEYNFSERAQDRDIKFVEQVSCGTFLTSTFRTYTPLGDDEALNTSFVFVLSIYDHEELSAGETNTGQSVAPQRY